jgi:hypothetical protein
MNATTRWMAVGRSDAEDSYAAGLEAASAAMRADDVELVLVFCSSVHDDAALLAGVNGACGGAPVIGCSSHGEIGPGGSRDGSVIVAALGGPGLSVATAFAEDVAGRQREAGAEVAECAIAIPESPYGVLLMLTDGLVPDQAELLRGAYSVAGASVPLFGGAAADQWAWHRTFQLHGDRVLSGAVVAAAVGSDAPIGIGTAHGWRKVGEPMIVTSSANGRVHTLDDEPALDVYLRRFNAPAELAGDRARLGAFARSRPIGIERRSGQEVRSITTGLDLATRSFCPGGDIHQGGLVWAMQADGDSLLDAVDDACREALRPLGGDPPVGLLTFSCAARRSVIGEEGVSAEGARFAAHAGDAPFAGFYTYGEIARTRGIDGFHNQTVVVLALG